MQRAAITAWETRSMRLWPTLEQANLDGWVLRAARGYTKRANSIYPLSNANRPMDDHVAACQAWCAARNLPVVFKLTHAAPPGLDALLVAQGYGRVDPSVVMTCPLQAGQHPMSPDIKIDDSDANWLLAFKELTALPLSGVNLLQAMLQNLSTATPDTQIGYATLWQDQQVVACALGVIQDGVLGVFDLIVSSEQRGHGFGRQLLQGVLAWGAAAQAHTAFLQVISANTAARHLYAELGFTEQYEYWYRAKPVA